MQSNMKEKSRLIFCFASIAIAIVAAIFAIKAGLASSALLNDFEALSSSEESYSSSCPGAQGSRKTQAVGCNDFWFGYKIKVGCCLGAEQCDYMNPCPDARFQCGPLWCDFE